MSYLGNLSNLAGFDPMASQEPEGQPSENGCHDVFAQTPAPNSQCETEDLPDPSILAQTDATGAHQATHEALLPLSSFHSAPPAPVSEPEPTAASKPVAQVARSVHKQKKPVAAQVLTSIAQPQPSQAAPKQNRTIAAVRAVSHPVAPAVTHSVTPVASHIAAPAEAPAVPSTPSKPSTRASFTYSKAAAQSVLTTRKRQTEAADNAEDSANEQSLKRRLVELENDNKALKTENQKLNNQMATVLMTLQQMTQRISDMSTAMAHAFVSQQQMALASATQMQKISRERMSTRSFFSQQEQHQL